MLFHIHSWRALSRSTLIALAGSAIQASIANEYRVRVSTANTLSFLSPTSFRMPHVHYSPSQPRIHLHLHLLSSLNHPRCHQDR
ncbi:MAG: hypothetical protein J3Q66DRAFT_7919 [Benniella sp.]|nr:MAG: hypothetical protein J3Q66DRAFT_7919 [Benniella sp.]